MDTPLSQDLSPDPSYLALAAPSEPLVVAKRSPPTLLPLAMVERQPRRAAFVGIAASVLIGTVSAGLNDAEASKTQAAVAPVNQMRTTPLASALSVETSKLIVPPVEQGSLSQYIAQAGGITIEAEMPTDVSGSLDTGVIFVFEATSDGEWKEQPVADIVPGKAITYLPPPEASTLGFVAGEATAAIDLKPGFAGRICLKLDTSSRSDYLWALGNRRSTTITGIRPALTDQATCSAYFASENRSRGAASKVYARLDPAA